MTNIFLLNNFDTIIIFFIFNLSSYILRLDPHSGEGLWVAYTVPSVCGQFSCHHHGGESVGWSSREVQVDLNVGHIIVCFP